MSPPEKVATTHIHRRHYLLLLSPNVDTVPQRLHDSVDVGAAMKCEAHNL